MCVLRTGCIQSITVHPGSKNTKHCPAVECHTLVSETDRTVIRGLNCMQRDKPDTRTYHVFTTTPAPATFSEYCLKDLRVLLNPASHPDLYAAASQPNDKTSFAVVTLPCYLFDPRLLDDDTIINVIPSLGSEELKKTASDKKFPSAIKDILTIPHNPSQILAFDSAIDDPRSWGGLNENARRQFLSEWAVAALMYAWHSGMARLPVYSEVPPGFASGNPRSPSPPRVSPAHSNISEGAISGVAGVTFAPLPPKSPKGPGSLNTGASIKSKSQRDEVLRDFVQQAQRTSPAPASSSHKRGAQPAGTDIVPCIIILREC